MKLHRKSPLVDQRGAEFQERRKGEGKGGAKKGQRENQGKNDRGPKVSIIKLAAGNRC